MVSLAAARVAIKLSPRSEIVLSLATSRSKRMASTILRRCVRGFGPQLSMLLRRLYSSPVLAFSEAAASALEDRVQSFASKASCYERN